MSIILSILAAAVVSYLLGSCNSSIIVVRLLKNEDIREHGSCNAGLTNTLRCYGKKCALITLIIYHNISPPFLIEFHERETLAPSAAASAAFSLRAQCASSRSVIVCIYANYK